jgi:hypothetical protein
MTSRLRRQLVLDFDSTGRLRPVERMPEGLIEALAELLIEALGDQNPARTKGNRDEPKDYR